ncbi:MAG TPA: SPOR domain-containing protein [Syntrophales bacterium]|nr:SPOR domain-containing protein [Syntrophales bacterium]
MARNVRPFEVRMGKLGIVVFVIGMSLFVFAAFLFGVHVGRHIDTLPEEIAWGIPKRILDGMGLKGPAHRPEPVLGQEEPAVSGGTGVDETVKERVTPPETGTGTPMTVSPAAPPDKRVTPAPSPQGMAESAPSGPAGQAAPPRPEDGGVRGSQRNDEYHAKAQERTKAEAPASSGRYWVQVASFQRREKALEVAKKVKALGYRPEVTEQDIEGKGRWYRITVPGFAGKGEAEKAAARLAKAIKGVDCAVRGH